MIPGNKATVIFQTGVLTGGEFDIQTDSDGNLTGYIHAERRFQLVPVEEDEAVYPNETFKPHAGDKYAVFNISLLQSYVRNDAIRTEDSWTRSAKPLSICMRTKMNSSPFRAI